MNNTIFITDFSKIKLSDKFLMLKTPKGEIGLDIHFLLNQKSDSEFAYFNATKLAKMFDKRYEQLTRGEQWKEYVEIVEQNLITQICVIKKTDKIFFNSNNSPKAIVSRRGRYGGSWLHHDLAIQFCRMLDVRWGYELDQFMKNLIKHTEKIKIERTNTKFLFHPLTDIIKDVYIPAQDSENAKAFAYPTLLDLVNKKALGVVAWVYKKNHGITDEMIKADGKISIRDYMTKAELDKIKRVEQDLWGLIKYAKITDYHRLKENLESI